MALSGGQHVSFGESGMAFLEIDGLKKRYGAVEVLKDINIDLDKGGFLVLVGPSGCGKSTLLNTIAGLEAISDGEIRVDGHPINNLHPSKRDIAMVFQSYALYPNMTVRGNISFGMEMRGVAKPARETAIAGVAKTLQIEHLLDRRPSQLSGGQRQRVAMGRALVRDPQVFLFDEPLSNLDAKLRVDMRTEIKRLHATTGTTIVYVTHDQIEAMTLATKIAVLKDGVLQQVGTPADIYNRPNNLFVADFMGSPSMNLLKAKVASENGVAVLKLLQAGRRDVTLAYPPTIADTKLDLGRDVILGIRPEAITDRDGADRNCLSIVMVEGLVDVVEPAGSDTFVVTRLGDKNVTARMRSDVSIKPGEKLAFAFNLDKAVLFDPETGRRL
jgi:multiple sugar transport system ATP-binding protein